jgi:integrase
VSRNALGSPVSRYGDESWNYNSLSTNGKSDATLHFFGTDDDCLPDVVALIREQHKALIWLHIDAGKTRALMTIRNTNYAAGAWCQKACTRGVDLLGLLTNPQWLTEELGSLNIVYLKQTLPLINTLWRNREALEVAGHVPLQRVREAINAEIQVRSEPKQTPLMPSRVYCAVLAGLIAKLGEIARDLDEVLDAYCQSMAASRNAPEHGSPRQKMSFRAKALAPVVQRMKALGYDRTQVEKLEWFIIGRINLYQSALMHAVAAFTGMRVGEVSILPLHDVLETFEDRGRTHYVIKGYTHKLNNGVQKPASWITSPEGHQAVLLAQRIGTAILRNVQSQPPADQRALLFPSIKSPFRAKASYTSTTSQEQLSEAISPVIRQSDIDELNRLELDRGWQRDGIEVGSRWPLTFHQLRRSLSVYAHRSGMVSLPALKAQLQHITDEMRAYYADGYSRAVNLVFDKDHFSHEWNAAKAESSFFGYAMGLLFSDGDLMGRGAERMAETVSKRTRHETLQLFTQESKI